VIACFCFERHISSSRWRKGLSRARIDSVVVGDTIQSFIIQFSVTREEIRQYKTGSRVTPTSTMPDRHNTTQPSAIAAPQTISNDILNCTFRQQHTRVGSLFSNHCSCSQKSCHQDFHMFSRINQVARHLSRPLPNYLHRSAAAATSRLTSSPAIMADANNKRTINTAACLIIGDEVLGGKVGRFFFFFHSNKHQCTSKR